MCQTLTCAIRYRVLRKQRKTKSFCSQEASSLVGEMDNHTSSVVRVRKERSVCSEDGVGDDKRGMFS